MNTLSKSIAVFALTFCSIIVNAQKPPIKLGDVPNEDVILKEYAPDPDADALILCDYGYLDFSYDLNEGEWVNTLNRICRIKIFNDDGYQWATQQISLYDDNKTEQSISQIKGYTYNMENGKLVKTKLEKDHIFEEKASENYNRTKFTMPNVKEGSVIEFSYSIRSNYITILDKWQFQRSIPVKWSEYIVSIPEYLYYLKNMQGFEKFYQYETSTKPRSITWTNTKRGSASLYGTTQTTHSNNKFDYKDNVSHMVAKDLVALKDENFVGNFNNYFLSIDFQLSNYRTFSDVNHSILGDWNQVIDKFLKDYEDFGPNLNPKSFYKDVTSKIMTEYQDPIQRTAAVNHFVSNHMKWNDSNGIVPRQNIKKSYDEKSGTCADINVLLVSMLRAVEIDADPVIISTINHGLVHPISPIIDKYNYLIVRAIVDGKTILLDATEKDFPLGMLPYRCLNQRGYAISKSNPGWVDLTPQTGQEKVTFCQMNLQEDGTMKGSVSYKLDGYSAVGLRNNISQDGKEKYIENLKSSHASWAITNVEIDVPEKGGESVKEQIDVEVSGSAESMGNLIYLNPIISDRIEENPLKQNERKLPIEFIVPVKKRYISSIAIPDGYAIDELPESINLATSDGTANLKYSVQSNGKNIQLNHSWQIDKSFYAPDKFQELKEFYAMLVAKHNEQIVLKKVE